ncbi:MAG: sigma-54 dependent transcriptional regulator [Armatimonadota bacterium]|nr:sigma-54 dependent transcriptional regulator [Armatimonadota bacterium]MDR7562465.1 sigma-54 dependent transcriptional regulator [Armatimonadota bacterium]MDR7566821.1 sigma-54 dependent transcriptional regulator [Armatimonadota bacterium]MDR7601178.1 sigma-54 dependent transcriptional regulator [Armatimonadota bacterium]
MPAVAITSAAESFASPLRGLGVLVVDGQGLLEAAATRFEQEGASVLMDRGKDPAAAHVVVTADPRTVPELVAAFPGCPVLVVHPEGTVEEAVVAVRNGALDFLTGPGWEERLFVRVLELAQERRLREERARLQTDLARAYRFDGVVGTSPAMLEVLRVASIVAPTDATVLLVGESGTGKELVARSIHLQSRRASGPLVVMHCGAIPETLLETEIFGHEKGAYTHALTSRPGKFEQAHGGTIFLDEVGEMSPRMQVKLLRVLQERVVERVGGTRPIKVDCRVVAATNRDLVRMVQEGTFREDLYYRLNVVTLRLPPLRERMEDVPLLAEFFVQKYRKQTGKPVRGLREAALRKLLEYPWPGNVRELEAVIHRAVILAQDEWIGAADVRLDGA